MCTKNQLHILMEKLHVGLPTCPFSNFEDVRTRVGDLNCWNVSQYFGQDETADAAGGGVGVHGGEKVTTTQPTNLQKFYKKHKKMPAFRGRRGWCGCLQDDEPPEICVVAQGVVPLQTVTPTQPMPSVDELDAKFAELVEELDLTAPNKVAMLNLPAQKKWQIYCSRKNPCDEPMGDGQVVASGPTTPEQYIEWLREIINQLTVSPDDSPSHEYSNKLETHVVHVDGLKTALRTSTHSFVLRFIELQGLNALLELLENLDHRLANSNLHTSLIGCIKALMNNSTGRAHVLSHPTSINTIAQSLAADNIKTKVAALEILGAVCLVPGGHKTVLKAMLHFQQYSGERARFQGVINDLDRSTGAYRDEVSLKTAIMSFINAVLNYGPGQHNLEFRLHLRYEFLMLGMEPIIVKLRKHENETLDRHLNFFEMVRNEDEKEFSRKFNEEQVDTKSATAMFDLLRRKLSHSSGYQYLMSLLQHLLLLPFTGNTSQYWLMFDRIVQQIVLQQEGSRPNSLVEGQEGVLENGLKDGIHDPDVNPIVIDVKKVIKLLVKEEELVAARTRADELEKENLDIQVKLAKREQDLDLRQQEKEDLETNLTRMRERLEKESANHTQAVQRALNAEMRAEELQHRYAQEHQERVRLERLVTEGSIPDDQKVAGLQGSLPAMSQSTSPVPPPPPKLMMPPPPPPCLPGPPPPMPPMGGMGMAPMMTKVELPKKNIPPSSNPLKSFNWSKLPDSKVNGTIWSELDESKLYNSMDLESVDKLFCAYQKNGVQTIQTDGSIEEDLKLVGKSKPKVVSVIDGRRAQNCTILLSKLKMSDEDICKVLISMDCNEQLPIDMVEQLLKFTPLAEERALLEEHSDDIESLGRADRFLFEISKINHYEQRLRSLHYKKRFQVTVNEVMPRLTNVMEASREVARSRRLRKLLEIVLALGNYMNRGARGNANGFRLASLNRLVDTKSSASKGTTLLHYLVQVIETKYKDLLKLDEDLPHVRDGAKVSMGEMEKDIAMLRNGLAEVSREIEFHRGLGPTQPGDKFLTVMCEFQAQASVRLTELEDKFQDMKTRFDRAVRLFGEDGSLIQPDEFFGIFDKFLASFMEARNDNENIKRRQEEDEKRAKQEVEMKKRTIDRKSKDGLLSSMAKNLGLKSSPNKNESANKGEFDDLISALRTGDVFGEDMAKYKRSRKPKANSTTVVTTQPNSNAVPAGGRSSFNGRDDRERSGSRR